MWWNQRRISRQRYPRFKKWKVTLHKKVLSRSFIPLAQKPNHLSWGWYHPSKVSNDIDLNLLQTLNQHQIFKISHHPNPYLPVRRFEWRNLPSRKNRRILRKSTPPSQSSIANLRDRDQKAHVGLFSVPERLMILNRGASRAEQTSKAVAGFWTMKMGSKPDISNLSLVDSVPWDLLM